MQNIQGDHFIIGIYGSASKKYVSLPACQTSVLLYISLSIRRILYTAESVTFGLLDVSLREIERKRFLHFYTKKTVKTYKHVSTKRHWG